MGRRHGAIVLHHLHCPWRPADLEQRDGRILPRQGNQNPEVQVIRYFRLARLLALLAAGRVI